MPPPPPPPGAPPPPSFSLGSVKPAGERKDLLKDIQAGAKLRKTTTNDRSAPIVSTGKASTPAPSGGGGGRAENNSSQNVGPLPGIGGLFAGGIPTLKKTKGGVSTGRSNNDFAPLNRDPTPGNGSLYKNSYNSTSSSLNSSPSLSPSPSPVGSTPTRGPPFPSSAPPLASSAPPPPPSNPKPSVPNTKPNLTPRGPSGSPGLVHPSSKPPPPPPSKSGDSSSNLNLARNQTVSKSFNQTIGHGPQGRPVLHNLGERTTKDDTSIRNGHAPPPPLRTVSQAQITTNKLPTRAPPPPPPGHKRPSQPPPPPPSNPPPPPGIQPPNKALPPPPPNHLSGDPPTPPTRRDSMYRAGHNSSGYNSSASSTGESFESRFSSRFKAPQFLPPPEPFSGCQKTYPSKNTIPVRHGSQIKRTPAPPPPPGKGQAAYGSLGRAPSAPRLWTTTTTGVL